MTDLASRVSKLSSEKQALFAQRIRRAAVPPAESQRIPRRAGVGPASLSFAQERLWFLDRLAPGSTAYNLVDVLLLSGDLDRWALAAALGELVRRHESLRTIFDEIDGRPVQKVVRFAFVAPEIELSHLPEVRREAEALRLARMEGDTPFDLTTGPLLRILLLQLAEREHVAVLTVHHIASDAWSFEIFVREFAVLYRAFVTGISPGMPELEIQYADFAVWQRQRLAGSWLADLLQFWRQQLAGAPELLELPTDRPRPAQQGLRGASVTDILPQPLADRLRHLARERQVTLFVLLFTVFEALVHRWTGQADFLIGTPVANRDRVELEPLIGFLVNTLVLRADLTGDPTFLAALDLARVRVLDATSHQELPFERLVEELRPQRSLGHHPLVQVVLALENPPASAVELPGLTVSPIALPVTHSRFDLTLFIRDTGRELVSLAEYDSDLFDAATVGRLLGYFEHLLAAVAADQGRRLSSLPLASEAERHHLLCEWNDTTEPRPAGRLVHELVEQQAARSPKAPALIGSGCVISYGELRNRANRLAYRLRRAGVGPEEVVALLFPRTPDVVIAMLAVLKAGGAYLPLDPAYPAERLTLMVADARCRCLLTAGETFEVPGVARLSLIDGEWLTERDRPPSECEVSVVPENLAYVIYTSGSTGRPKGVAVSHRNLLNLITWHLSEYPVRPGDRVSQIAGLAFDAAVWEVWPALTAGGCLCFASDQLRTDPAALATWLASAEVSWAFAPTPLVEGMLQTEWPPRGSLHALLTGGDSLHRRPAAGWPWRLVNHYGPTENTVVATRAAVHSADTAEGITPSIGLPIENVRAVVVDTVGQLALLGVAGELRLGGASLARGYLGKPDLTAERFVPDPWGDPGERLYRTGDLVRRLARGDLVFLGRIDRQVKVRGFRIELGEVEAALVGLQAVREAVVETIAGPQRLIAYVVLDDEEGTSPDTLREALEWRLPEFMIPSAWVVLPALPLTPNGKVDRAALAALLPKADALEVAQAPRTPIEELLAELWKELLGRERVGVLESFFELGGHSLLATQLTARVRSAFGIELPLRAVFEDSTIAALAARIELLLQRNPREPLPAIRRVPRSARLPLSFAQERLWFLDRLDPGTPTYNLPLAFGLRGRLSVPAFAACLSVLGDRHETLRTNFRAVAGEPEQVIAPSLTIAPVVVDLRGLPRRSREAVAQALAEQEALRPFDLEGDTLLRVALLRLEDERHVILFTQHHIISDGWSMGVLLREFAALYNAFIEGRRPSLPVLQVQYVDFAVWQRSWLAGDKLERQLSWWRRHLEGAPALLDLPLDRPRPAVASSRGDSVPMELPFSFWRDLRELARARQATPFMVMLTAFQALMARWSGQDDVVVGTPVANRNRPEIAGLIGFFVNTLALRLKLARDQGFTDLLANLREASLEAYAHQDLPFERLVEKLRPERNLSHPPLFQVMLALQNAAPGGLELSGLTWEPVGPVEGVAQFDLSLYLSEDGNGSWNYRTTLFDRSTIRRLASAFEQLLLGVVEQPDRRISELPLLSQAERLQLVVDWNDTARAYPPLDCLHHLFEAQADRTPEAVAVRFEERVLTYRELEAASNRLAHRLRAQGVGMEVVVGVLLERSLEMVVALFGVLKAGGAYLPLDPSYPGERLAACVEDAAPRLVLTVSALAHLAPAGTRAVLLDAGDEITTGPDVSRPELLAGPESLAYVIFTSGSTGRPKGAMNAHRGIVNRLLWMQEAYGLGVEDRVLQKTPFSFDVSVWEFFWPLAVGARLVLARPEGHRDPAYLIELIAREGITTLHFVPSMLQAFLEAPGLERCGSLRRVITSGEELTAEVAARCLDRLPWAELDNLYGPTEAAVDVTAWPCRRGELGSRVPIGRPIANLRIHLLDGWEPVPVGVPGELFIGGVGVGRGYLGRPALTAERFVPDPLSPEPGGRLYRTGDLARHRPDGAVDFLGRLDHQVKIRGFRIELGEIEAALAQAPGVKAAVVGVREARGDRQLVAYVAVDGGAAPAPGELRERLRSRLPEAMIPAAFVLLDALPLNPNGKVDRKALASITPEIERRPSAGEGPRTPVEELVAGIWSKVLGLERVGLQESFFELGGHSLLATRVVSRVRESFGIELPLRVLFETPTVAGLGSRIEALARCGSTPVLPPLRPARRAGPLPLSFAQERLWFLDQFEPGSARYNMPAVLRLTGNLSLPVFAAALSEIVRRHEVLRTRIGCAGEVPVQIVDLPRRIAPSVVDLSGVPEAAREAEALRLVQAEVLRPFNLALGPLLRLSLLRLAAEDHMVLANMHHIVSDGWSVGVLTYELATLYSAFLRGQPSSLLELPIQYADFAVWQRSWLTGEVLDAQLAYWRGRLAGAPSLLELPADRPRPAVLSSRGGTVEVRLPAGARQAAALSRSHGATLFMTLLGLFQVLLGRHADIEDLVVGSPIAGRTHSEIEPLIGFFVNTLVLRLDLSGEPTVRELLARVRETTLEAFAHQDVPFEKLVEELGPERDFSRTPLFQVMFALQSTPVTQGGELSGIEIKSVPFPSRTAKFDLSLVLSEVGSELEGTVEYSADLFDATTVERLVERFQVLLQAAAADPERPVSAMPLLPNPERQQLLYEWNDTTRQRPSLPPVHEMFAEQARRHPGAPAVVASGRVLTYGELEEAANRLAHHLRTLGVGPEIRVAVCAERTLERVAGILGVLKAGGAYVSLDPAYPHDRMAFLLQDAAAPVVLTEERFAARLPKTGAAVLRLDTDWEFVAGDESAPPSVEVLPDNLAYVVYTSGSTGKPKGVEITHAGLAHLVRWHLELYGMSEQDRGTQVSSPAYDASIWDLWACLAAGASSHIPDEEARLSAAAMVRWWAREGITVTFVPTPLAEGLLEQSLPPEVAVRALLVGGDRLHRWPGPGLPFRLMNHYGPAEYSVVSTVTEVSPLGHRNAVKALPAIGRPIDDTRIYVLGRDLRPVPLGVPGELYVSGAGLARGYLRRPELTAERFVPDPLIGEPGSRMYRTGDRVRWMSDGRIDFLGRIDHQVKLRGHRIELGEIESVLGKHPDVGEAAVLLREDQPGDKHLVAYVAHASGAWSSKEALHGFLRRELPEHMVPAVFVLLDALPLTPNGKVDRRALAGMEPSGPAVAAASRRPRGPVAEAVAGIWEEVLGRPVGARDDFFDLGGHSLLATRVVSRLSQVFGAELPLRALFEHTTVESLTARLEALLQDRVGGAPGKPPLERGPRPFVSGAALSFAQERLWFLDRLDPGNVAYNAPAAVGLSGRLEVGALRSSAEEIVRRHEVLRGTFATTAEGPVQWIAPPAPVPLPVVDLAGLAATAREAEAERLAAAEAGRPFDLASGPLLRLALVRLEEAEHLALLTFHHIVADAWSLGLFAGEMGALYAAFTSGRRSPLPELAWQYADFAVWQRRWLQGEVLERQLAFWKAALAGAPTFLALPADRPRPPVQRFRGRVLRSTLPAELVDGLRAVGRRRGATLFMSLLSGLGALLGRYTGQDDLLVGTPIADRPLVETEGLIGLFLNTLALRVDLTRAPGLAGLVERVREVTFAAYAHRDLPFEKLVEELALERNLSHSPLFQVMLVLHNEPPGALELPGLRLALPEVEGAGAKFDLVLNCEETDDGLAIRWIYNSDLYDAARISRMADHLARLLEGAVADPDLRLGDLPLLSRAEERQLLAWNDSARELPLARGFVELFRERAAATPEAVAAVCGGEAVSYAELDRRTDRLAWHLAGLGAGEEGVVAVLAERGIDLLSAMIALFKAGLVYLPLDPGHPANRHAQVLRESRARFVVASAELAPVVAEAIASLPVEARPELLGFPDPAAPVAERPLAAGEPLRLAYVIFTSGSTGVPKGAMVAHAGMVNHLFAKIGDLDLAAGDIVAQTASQCFDISVWQFLAVLVVGGRVEIFPDEIAQNPALLLAESRRRGVTILETVPSLLRALVEEAVHVPEAGGGQGAGALRWMIPTGEALPPDLCNRWLELFPHIPLINAYGPTECSDDVTHCTLRRPLPGEVVAVPIGRPVVNMRLHVVSRGFDLQPVGVPGELCVGGVGVGRGYLNDPLRTAGVFVPDPFAGALGARLYRTGDLARWLASGEIEFLGRIDHQVKVRGFRIELGEIESALAAHPAVREAVVLAREQRTGERRLVAYLGVRGEAPSAAELAAFLGQRIPEYMVPSAFVCLPALPLTANGKVDRKALPEPEEQPRSTELVPPRNALEEHLAGHFRELLGRDEVGVHDDFFDLGGSSISGAVLINRLQRELGEIVHVVVLFDAPTIEKLAAYLVREHPEAVARRWGVEALAGRPAEGPAETRVDAAMVAEMRRLIRPLAPRPGAALKNPRAVFLLSPPRSGSTLLRVLLAGHPELFAPPELELLSFDTLAERRAAFPGRDAFWLEGAIRTVMEAKPCDVEEARAFLEAREAEGWTSRQLYRQLQEWIGGRTLVDKTPSYALDLEILRRAEEDFESPLYIHLLRHPGAVVRSFEEAKLDQLFFRAPHRFSRRQLAELIWLVSHQNILELLSGIDPRRHLQVTFEELVRDPEPVLAEICRLIGVELHPDMLDPYKEKRSRMTDGLHAESRMLGDVKFHQHRAVDAQVAEQWREHLSEESLGDLTWSMAEALGYRRRPARPAVPAGRPQGFSSLVLLQEGRPAPPLFLVHPVGGNVLCYGQLARRLGPDQPIYGLQSAGLGNGRPHETIEQMAAHYLGAVRQVQPRGPYRLAGWSVGGTIAYEMARRLEQAGEEVELLALLDSVAPGAFPDGEPETGELLLGLARDLAGLAGREEELARESLEGLDPEAAVARVLSRAQELGALPADLDPDQVERLWRVFRANATAARRYVAGPYRGRTLVLASAHNPFRDVWGPDLGWGPLAAGLETELLDADHYGLLLEPAVVDLAQRLRLHLTPSAAGRP